MTLNRTAQHIKHNCRIENQIWQRKGDTEINHTYKETNNGRSEILRRSRNPMFVRLKKHHAEKKDNDLISIHDNAIA